ncbi:MAG: biotin--[acetyl-CoA-carboxylase] ligase [Desulfobacteraceae bacterium]|nr:biotin--[acetyl-CoA-carboxylase] ligase [Desulfobacteraceae bacterium]
MRNMKEKILQALFKTSDDTVSGVALSEELGISRVAVWKHIKALKASGVKINSTSKGYSLPHKDDLLFPFCFEKYQDKIHFFPSVTTTMNTAKKMARANSGSGIDDFSVIIAQNQTNGRGRLNREWISTDGGLWFTLILKPDLPPPLAYILNFAASLSLARCLNTLFKIDAKVKWPNDLLIKNEKLAGLLSEMETEGDMLKFVNIGIGLNVNNNPKKDIPDSISINNITGKHVSRREILIQFLSNFEELYQDIINHNISSQEIISMWKEHTSTIGKYVNIETFGKKYKGLAIDVDTTGALLLQVGDGANDRHTKDSIKKVIYGDCFYKGNN